MTLKLEEHKDLHRETAAKIFGVNYQDVTPEQRRAGKQANFRAAYSNIRVNHERRT